MLRGLTEGLQAIGALLQHIGDPAHRLVAALLPMLGIEEVDERATHQRAKQPLEHRVQLLTVDSTHPHTLDTLGAQPPSATLSRSQPATDYYDSTRAPVTAQSGQLS